MNPSDQDVAVWYMTDVYQHFLKVPRYLRQQNPDMEQNWGFIKSALIIAVEHGYSASKGSDGMRQFKKMERQVPFFLPEDE